MLPHPLLSSRLPLLQSNYIAVVAVSPLREFNVSMISSFRRTYELGDSQQLILAEVTGAR